MSILTSASSTSVSRGYDYYKNGKVMNVNQLNDLEFEGYVEGSLKDPYYVKINIKHPKKSYCDCPHANGNITCKHMTALYFEVFPEEVEDYESWLNSDYDDEEDEYYDYDDYDDYDEYDNDVEPNNFEAPLFFDVVLKKYIDDLSNEKLKEILWTELKNNEKRTYDLYLEKEYKKYLENSDKDLVFLNALNKKMQDLTEYYDYNYNNYNKELLNTKEKKKIEELCRSKRFNDVIDKILLNEKLTVYTDYEWIAHFYKNNKKQNELFPFLHVLEEYLNNLKHYSIRNNIPKANVLIIIYLLSDFNIKETANSLLDNAKYEQYIDYVIENSDDVIGLYEEFKKLITKSYLKNKNYIPNILHAFVGKTDYEVEQINIDFYLYSYLCLGGIEYLNFLQNLLTEEVIIDFVEYKTKDIFLLVKLYRFFHKNDKLWKILSEGKYKYLLLSNIDVLKDDYTDKLYGYFIEEVYAILKLGKNRENYNKVAKYVKAIAELKDGNALVRKTLSDLKKSPYQNCPALFEEINKVLQ